MVFLSPLKELAGVQAPLSVGSGPSPLPAGDLEATEQGPVSLVLHLGWEQGGVLLNLLVRELCCPGGESASLTQDFR